MARTWRRCTTEFAWDWHMMWIGSIDGPCIAMDKQGWFWLGANQGYKTLGDIGPFDSFEAAAACFEITFT